MNEIQKVYNSLTDEELKQAIIEIKERKETGFLTSDGIIKKIWLQIHNLIKVEYTTESVEHNITWEFCRRWIEKQ